MSLSLITRAYEASWARGCREPAWQIHLLRKIQRWAGVNIATEASFIRT